MDWVPAKQDTPSRASWSSRTSYFCST